MTGREVRFAPYFCNLLLQTRLKTLTSITRNKQIIPSLRSSHFPGKMNGVDKRICGRGALIVFEGCDRSGKSTQCGMLVEHLRSTGRCVEHFRFPGKMWFLFSLLCCRVRSIQDAGFQAHDIPETSIKLSNSKRLQERLREDQRLQDLAEITVQHFLH